MRSLSGIKPTGKIHLGNYFGAIKQFIENQDKYENFYFIPDYHSLTSNPSKSQLEEDSFDIVVAYLALGLNPEKSTIFFQSSVKEHCELTWILSNITPLPLLQRAHAYKDALSKNKILNSAVFFYPVLMAADILMYDADVIPVGKDQKQHVEIARDLAIKFNNIYGETFKLPEPYILENSKVVPGTDGNKMSKSYNNTIKIFGTDKEIKESIMGIVTDSKSVEEPKEPKTCNIFKIYKLFLSKEEENNLKKRYKKGNVGYGTLKKELLEIFMEYFKEARKKREELLKNREYIEKVLKDGANRARFIAEKKLKIVKEKIGLLGRKY